MMPSAKNEKRLRIEALVGDISQRLLTARSEMQTSCNYIVHSDPELHARIRACIKEISDIRDELYSKVWG